MEVIITKNNNKIEESLIPIDFLLGFGEGVGDLFQSDDAMDVKLP